MVNRNQAVVPSWHCEEPHCLQSFVTDHEAHKHYVKTHGASYVEFHVNGYRIQVSRVKTKAGNTFLCPISCCHYSTHDALAMQPHVTKTHGHNDGEGIWASTNPAPAPGSTGNAALKRFSILLQPLPSRATIRKTETLVASEPEGLILASELELNHTSTSDTHNVSSSSDGQTRANGAQLTTEDTDSMEVDNHPPTPSQNSASSTMVEPTYSSVPNLELAEDASPPTQLAKPTPRAPFRHSSATPSNSDDTLPYKPYKAAFIRPPFSKTSQAARPLTHYPPVPPARIQTGRIFSQPPTTSLSKQPSITLNHSATHPTSASSTQPPPAPPAAASTPAFTIFSTPVFTPRGQTHKAESISSTPSSNLSLPSTTAPPQPLTAPSGDPVVVFGNPNKRVRTKSPYDDYIEEVRRETRRQIVEEAESMFGSDLDDSQFIFAQDRIDSIVRGKTHVIRALRRIEHV